ncbi:hypothetical protein EG328_008800 [Venturia inaequalis]|uniref:S-adenosyl-L-methionine-dependent methyltransferase n=1 Tax=Venturia inaequalis TaxID=5025 RepID=A0A8H3UAN7_VENIN|nr:hypothetical protein EG328_008800 [Venturia inaequalis]KAE9976500.1 hypothetical protein EG327_008016 [Venturia inaequalis]RDI77831.1 hypothetical protein Vi05172_g12119 [Venturia inaequalis]
MAANDRFDKEAAEWDNNPFTVKSSRFALSALLENVPQLQAAATESGEKNLDVLEIGCGTGLLSLLIAPYLKSLTAVDTAEGMIKALQTKLAAQTGASNIDPVCVMLENPDDPKTQDASSAGHPKRFDLVISHLVLHHIPSLPDILKTMWGTLKPNGRIALTDFENFGPEAIQFHPQHKLDGVERHGITKPEMEALLREARFVDVTVKEAWRMPKDVESGGSMDFPFLICMGTKAD